MTQVNDNINSNKGRHLTYEDTLRLKY